MIRSVNKLLAHSILLLMSTALAHAGSWNTDANNVVLDGYDVVAYRNSDRAVKGSPDYTATYDGVKFQFSNKQNLTAFKQDPQLYLPQYHGFCAFAMGAKNAKVPANADTFKLYNGKLLVFFNDMYEGQKFNTKIPWNQDEKKLYSQAEKNWRQMEGKK